MNIVIPMAGAGTRFLDAGWKMPKMLIAASGRPMLHWAVESLKPWLEGKEIIFVCLKEHLDHFPLERCIIECCKKAKIVALNATTRGQAETVLASALYLRPNEPLLIYNCDTFMKTSLSETQFWRRIQSYDGMISVFEADDPCFSYAETDGRGLVKRVMEKTVISTYATTGLYCFSRAKQFLEAAEAAVSEADTVHGEYYVAPLYNWLIRQGCRFVIHQADICYPLGTPNQLAVFEEAVLARTHLKKSR